MEKLTECLREATRITMHSIWYQDCMVHEELVITLVSLLLERYELFGEEVMAMGPAAP